MINQKMINKQLKKIDFNPHGWNRSEVAELHEILLHDEEIFECVNGIYEGGFALLVSTDVRVLLIDKKPLNFLNIEDIRFDMINEIDYNHRLLGASIIITTGNKALKFRSYNKLRLRKLIGHVQHCMAENKKKQSSHAEDQKTHLEQINQQLQTYLVAQYEQQQKLQEHLTNQTQQQNAPTEVILPAPVKPSNELADYLYAHGLIEKYREETGKDPTTGRNIIQAEVVEPPVQPVSNLAPEVPVKSTVIGNPNSQLAEIYADGMQEIFGQRAKSDSSEDVSNKSNADSHFKLDPLMIAISKLPLVLRSRKFGLSLPSLPTPFTHHIGVVPKTQEPTTNTNAVAKPA